MTDISNSMCSTVPGLVQVKTGGAEDAERYADQLTELYESDFSEPSRQGTSLFGKERFRKKLLEDYIVDPSKAEYTIDPSFKIVTLWNDKEQLVGFACGSSLPPGSQWWKDVREPLPEGFDEEDGRRTLALFDVLVKKNLRGQGLGSLLHTQLLQGRREERVTLLSGSQLQPAYTIWQHWGYRKIGTAEPAEDGEILDVFIRPLK